MNLIKNSLSTGAEIAFAIIPVINTFEEPLKTQIKEAFAPSMSTIWKTMIGISKTKLITLISINKVPMNAHTDERYSWEVNTREEKRGKDEEAAATDMTDNAVDDSQSASEWTGKLVWSEPNSDLCCSSSRTLVTMLYTQRYASFIIALVRTDVSLVH